MFESAELAHEISDEQAKTAIPALRADLLDVQAELVKSAPFQVIVLVAGLDGAGRSEMVNTLNEWLDPRHVKTHGMGDPTANDLKQPAMWRFWKALPPKGKIGLFLGSWYTWPMLDRMWGRLKRTSFAERMQENARFEKMLVDEGALVLKFWLHLTKEQQRARLVALSKDKRTRWRVTERDWAHHARYDRLHRAAELAITLTSTVQAPWTIVSGQDRNYRNLTVGNVILEAVRARLAHKEKAAPAALPAPIPAVNNIHILHSLQLDQALDRKAYTRQLEKYQGRLNLLTRDPRFRDLSVAVVFEGNDAAGKGGAIRRITAALDARMYEVVPIAAPTDEERAHPYMWRFWRNIPYRCRITIFDRSWYGRVLVERVEGYCSPYDWGRAYSEINDFEMQLSQHDTIVVKFWLAIAKDEQLRRFKEREKTRFKRFKITEEDWRNRKNWERYESAVCDMVERTSTEHAPWTLVEANNKYYARIKVLKTLCRRIEDRLNGR